MDTFVDSSWYFLRYCDHDNMTRPFDRAAVDPWLPVPRYVGGIEHAILHLLYARFMTHALQHLGMVGHKEPFGGLLAQGMVLGSAYKCADTARYLQTDELDLTNLSNVTKIGGGAVNLVWEKMSKSKHNGVDPGAVVDQWGADTARLFTLFKAPPAAALEWDDRAIAGQHRWLNRVWDLVHKNSKAPPGDVAVEAAEAAAVRVATHEAIKQVTRDVFDTQSLNTAVAALMSLSNTLGSASIGTRESLEGVCALVTMLAPFAPHIASELWAELSRSGQQLPAGYATAAGVHQQQWPAWDEAVLQRSHVTVVVQVGGKKRGTLQVASELLEDSAALEAAAMASEVGIKWLKGKSIKKAIVRGKAKLVNFVV